MKVKLLVGLSGLEGSWSPGSVVDLPEATASRLIASGQAEPVEPPEKKPRERAEKKPRENAAKNR